MRAMAAALMLIALFCLAPAAQAGDQSPMAKTVVNDLGMEFKLIPAGSFMMGSPEDEPGRQTNEDQHKVTITKPFYMQTTETTVGQWRAVMGKKFWGKRKANADYPVTKVSWGQVQEFIAKLNTMGQGAYRLPTEAEWEYACRAGTTTAYFFGPAISCAQAMFANNSELFKEGRCRSYYEKKGLEQDRCAPVKSFPPNAWGLYDMHGNVWEWCQDWHDYYPEGPQTDPTGPVQGNYRARRGGSFYGGEYVMRSANRNFANPSFRERTLGFRLVREAR